MIYYKFEKKFYKRPSSEYFAYRKRSKSLYIFNFSFFIYLNKTILAHYRIHTRYIF